MPTLAFSELELLEARAAAREAKEAYAAALHDRMASSVSLVYQLPLT